MKRAPTSPPELPGLDYVRLLGAGGFSDVFLYDQHLPRRKVAVKVLLTDGLNPTARDAFVDEANLMAQLSAHPYIVTIFNAGVSPDDRPFFVMEYCSGPSLSELYKRDRFTVADALRTGVRLSSAIATAHAAGILHRDIKPANVLTNDFGWPALTDFGISSAVEDELPVHTTTVGELREAGGNTESQSVGMSVPWSPPEMFEDSPRPDVRSDVFSLAATTHTLLAGRTPFEIPGRSNGTLDLIGRIERGAITPIGRDDIPRSLTAVLQKGMASRRAERYASAVEFARALQRIELELGYAPTTIEVPNLAVRNTSSDAPSGGEDETRVRSVATIEAQPATPVGAPPASADETHVRSVTVIPPDRIGAPPASSAVAEGTVLRSSVIEERTELRPARASEAVAAPPTAPLVVATAPVEVEPPQPKRRLAILITVIVAVVLAIAVTVGIVFAGGNVGKGARPTPQPTGDGGSAIIDDVVPTPVLVSAKANKANTAVVFSWKNPSPKSGDSYRWANSEDPGSTRPVTTPTITIKRPGKGVRVCIDVYVQRQGNESPEALKACNPK